MTQIINKNNFEDIDYDVKNIRLPLRCSLLAYIVEPFGKISRKKSAFTQNIGYKRKVQKINKKPEIKNHKFAFIHKKPDEICTSFVTYQPNKFKLVTTTSSGLKEFSNCVNIKSYQIKEDLNGPKPHVKQEIIKLLELEPEPKHESEEPEKVKEEEPDVYKEDPELPLLKKEESVDIIVNINIDVNQSNIDSSNGIFEFNNAGINEIQLENGKSDILALIQNHLPTNPQIKNSIEILKKEVINNELLTDIIIPQRPNNYESSEIIVNENLHKIDKEHEIKPAVDSFIFYEKEKLFKHEFEKMFRIIENLIRKETKNVEKYNCSNNYR